MSQKFNRNNPMNLVKQDIGVWVKASDEFPKDTSALYTIRKDGKYSIASFSNEHGWEFIHNGKIAKEPLLYEWLKPLEQVYVLTEDELIELGLNNWVIKNGWTLHSSNEYYYKSKNFHDWPPDETASYNQLRKQFIQSLTK